MVPVAPVGAGERVIYVFGPGVHDSLAARVRRDLNWEAVLPRYNYIILGLLLVLMMLFRREGLIPEGRTKALLQTPSRTEAESLGADSLEAEAETEAIEHSDAKEDAKIAASAAAMAGSAAAPTTHRQEDER